MFLEQLPRIVDQTKYGELSISITCVLVVVSISLHLLFASVALEETLTECLVIVTRLVDAAHSRFVIYAHELRDGIFTW